MIAKLNALADRIETTLLGFGMGAQVVGGTVLPNCIEFSVVPQRRVTTDAFHRPKAVEGVRVNQLQARAMDLAVALAVPSVRVVAGVGAIRVQLPRKSSMVIYADKILEQANPSMPVALVGIDEDGKALAFNPANPSTCHFLIAGTTGSGKTKLAQTMVYSLMRDRRISEVALAVIDPKGDAMGMFGNRLLMPVASDVESAGALLTKLVAALERRMARKEGIHPRVIIYIDEIADLAMQNPALIPLITRIAQVGREFNFTLICATQKPTTKAIGSLLKSNLPVRLCGRVTGVEDARTALGVPASGAEQLNGMGDFIVVAPGLPRATRIQVAMPPEMRYQAPVQRALPAPAKVESQFDEWRRECLTAEGELAGGEAFASYCGFCKTNDMEPELNSTQFGEQMKGHYTKRHTRNGSVYTGVSLNE